MKSIVVYSSLTGNTKMVGEAIAEVLAPNCDIYKVEDNPDITNRFQKFTSFCISCSFVHPKTYNN